MPDRKHQPASTTRLRPALAGLACSALLCGCVFVGPDYAPPSPAELNVPSAWQNDAPANAAGAAIADWWQHLGDPVLTDLVARAMQANPDLQSAQARLREARARRRLAGANLWPTLGASVSAQYLKMSEGSLFGGGAFAGLQEFDDTRELYDAGFDASWEPDLFGGQRRAREAASADLEAAAASLHDAQVTLAAEVARNYVELRSAQARIAIGEANLASQSETLNLTEWRVQAGLATSLDEEQARTNVEQTRAAIPLLVIALNEAQHRLATLLGLAPGALADELAAPAPIPQIPEPLTIGIPADILRQRPDVAAAERSVAAETARIGEAMAARYPSLNLSGSVGVEALTIGALTNGSSVAASALGSLAQTIFDGGRIRAQIEGQTAIQEQALASYRSTVLAALEEVENALVSLANYRARAAALARGVDAARNAALLARHQYSAGLTDFQTVLDTERTILTIEESLVAAESNSTTAVIQLYKALGGGWTQPPTEDQPASTEAAS
jgi:NodT family efflux transporter outer membrane factor (OMF) lipoprotein